MAVSLDIGVVDLGSINEGGVAVNPVPVIVQASLASGILASTITDSLVWKTIVAAYPTASFEETFFFLDDFNPDPSSAADSSDFFLINGFLDERGSNLLLGTITLFTQDDNLDEPDEAFSLQTILTSLDIRDGSGQSLADLRSNEIAALFASVGGLTVTGRVTGTIIDNDLPPNTAPTAVNFVNTTPDLDENTSTVDRIKVADIATTDDGQGTNILSLSGSDAGVFELDGTTLYLKAGTPLDYETQSSYSVTVNVDDSSVGSTPDASNTFTLTLKDVEENTAPTDLALNTAVIAENVAAGATVGTFITTDAEGGSFTYEFVSGAGDNDNASFSIDGEQLKVNTSPNFEAKSSYSIRVKTIDADGLFYEKALTISVNNVNEAPIATGEIVSTSKNTAITIELGDNLSDPDVNGLANTKLNVTSTNNGNVSIDQDARLITFTPTDSFSGTASFKYTITDAGGLTSNAAIVTVEVGDIISTGNKDQNIQGNNGNDFISAGNGKDTIQGLGGNDTLLGNNGADTIDGGTGDDLINGGNGPDTLTGSAGKDKFVLTSNAGGDTITDFADGADLLALSGGLGFEQLTITGSNGNTLVQLGTTTLATLTGIDSRLITLDDFVTV